MTSSCNCPISWPTQTLFSVMSRSRPWDVAENVNQNLQENAFCECRPILIIVSITNHDLYVLVDTRGSELNKFRYSSRGHSFENDSWINYLYINILTNKQTNKQTKRKKMGVCVLSCLIKDIYLRPKTELFLSAGLRRKKEIPSG